MLAPLCAVLLAAIPSLEVVPSSVRPGDVVLLRVSGATAEPRGTVADRPVTFWSTAGEEWWALAPLPIEAPPGAKAVRVRTGSAELSAELKVLDPGFTSHTLTLDRKFVEPPPSVKKRIAADRKAFARAFSRRFSAPLFARSFDWPRRAPTSGRYGDQRVLNGKVSSVHYGLDITSPRGAPVLAANDGEVVLERDAYFSGKTVVLWHGAGVFTVYFHMDRTVVRKGQRVERGEQIGMVGATGRSTGPHLHWGVKVDGLYVDPESVLALDLENGLAPPRRAGPIARDAEAATPEAAPEPASLP